jgi:hypothetical protein
VIADPSHEPNVPAAITPGSVIVPLELARMAAGGTTTSLGTGKIELSMAMRTMTPR